MWYKGVTPAKKKNVISLRYAWLLWKKKKSCLKRKRVRKMTDEEGKLRSRRKEEFRSKVDDMFLVVFPLLFTIFNTIYWPVCLRGPTTDH